MSGIEMRFRANTRLEGEGWFLDFDATFTHDEISTDLRPLCGVLGPFPTKVDSIRAGHDFANTMLVAIADGLRDQGVVVGPAITVDMKNGAAA